MNLNLDELREDFERLSEEGGQGFLQNFVRMPKEAGHLTLRLLPRATAGMFGREKNPFYQGTRLHTLNKRSYHCPRVLEGGKWRGHCPVCEYASHLWKESEKKNPVEAKALQDQYRSIKANERYYYNVIVRQQYNDATGQVEKNIGPKIWSVGKKLHKFILRAILGDEVLEEDPLGDVSDPKKGRDIKVIKTIVDGQYPNYDTSKFLDVSVLGEPEQVEQWMAGLHDLSALRIVKDLEELKHELKVHLGLIPDKDAADFSEYEKPAGSTASTSSAVVVEKPAAKNEAVKTEAVQEDTDAPDESQAIADDDFIKELRSMS